MGCLPLDFRGERRPWIRNSSGTTGSRDSPIMTVKFYPVLRRLTRQAILRVPWVFGRRTVRTKNMDSRAARPFIFFGT